MLGRKPCLSQVEFLLVSLDVVDDPRQGLDPLHERHQCRIFLEKKIFFVKRAKLMRRFKCVFLKMGQLRPFSFIFGIFKQIIQFLQQINVKKCPSSIQYLEI